MEIFNSKFAVRSGESPYFEFTYADFDSLGGALLILFQVIVQAGWGELLYDWAWRFDDLTKSSLYFNTFSSVTNYVIISLLTGLIWEVFTYMEKQFEQQDKIEEQLDEIYYGNSLKRSYASKKSEKICSREASLSELEFANLNDSQMPKRQVKSLTSLEAPSTSARAEAIDINYTHSDFRNDIKPLRLIESMGPETPMKIVVSKGQPLFPSRFKVNVQTPSKSVGERGCNEEDRMLDQGPSDMNVNLIDKEEVNIAFGRLEFSEMIGSPLKKRYKDFAENNLEEPMSPYMTFSKSRSSQDQKGTEEESIDPTPINRKWKSPSNPGARLKRLSGVTGLESKGIAASLQEISEKELKKRHSKLYGKKMITRHFPDFRGGDQMPVIPDSEQSIDNLDYLEEDPQGEEDKGDYEDLSKKIVNKRLQKLREEGSFNIANMMQDKSLFGKNGTNRKLLSLPARQDSRATRKFGRSDSLNASVKISHTSFVPVINKIFINDMDDPQLEKTESKNLEKEFYMRKIVVCKHVSIEKNQMEYTDNLHSKEKFKYEKKLLKLDSDDSSESEEEMAAPTKSEEDLTRSETKTKQLEGLRKKMKAKSNFEFS